MRSALAVFAVAIAVRVAVVAQGAALEPLRGDALEYHEYALSIVSEGRYARGSERAGRAPGYPLFLASIYAAVGPRPAAVLWVQALIGALTCVILYCAAGRALGSPWDLGIGLASATYRGLFDPCALILTECLYSALLSGVALAILRADWKPHSRAVLLGATLGSAALVRPEALLVGGAILALQRWTLPTLGLRSVALAAALFLAPPALWAARNAAVLGSPVPTSTRGGSTAYLGLYFPIERRRPGRLPSYTPPQGLDELAVDAAFARRFRDLLRELSPGEILNAYAFNLATFFYPFLPAYDWGFVALLPFWLVGLPLAARKSNWAALSVAVAVSYATYTLFGGPALRYREGVSPLVILLAGLGAASAAGRMGPALAARWGGAWLGLQILLWAAASPLRRLALMGRDVLWHP